MLLTEENTMRIITYFLLVIYLVLVVTKTKADTSIYVQSWSTHYVKYDGNDKGGSFNSEHKTLAVKHNEYSAGTFVNSYNNRSHFVGYSADLLRQSSSTDLNSNWTLGGMLVSGYNRPLLLVPILGYTVPSTLSFGSLKPEIEINLIPGAITYSIKLTLK